MPRPVHMTARGRPLWTRASLIAEGVLSVGEDGMTDAERATAIGRGTAVKPHPEGAFFTVRVWDAGGRPLAS